MARITIDGGGGGGTGDGDADASGTSDDPEEEQPPDEETPEFIQDTQEAVGGIHGGSPGQPGSEGPGSPLTRGPSGAGAESGTDGGQQSTQRTEPASDAEREAQRDLVSRSEFIDEEDVRFVDRDGRTFATVDPATARLLGQTGFQQGEEFVQEGGFVGETGGGEDFAVPGGTVRGPPEQDGLLLETGGGEDFGVQGGDIVSQVEAAIERQTGRRVNLTRDDIQVSADGRVTLTGSGAAKVATAPLSNAVAGFERRGTAALRGAAGAVGVETGIEVDVPGEGPLVTSVGQRRDLGHVGGELGRRFEDELAAIERDILAATEPETGAFAGQFLTPEQRAELAAASGEFTAAERRRQELAGAAVSGLAGGIPLFATGAAGLAKDALDLGAAAGTAAAEGDLERLQQLEEGVVGAGVEQAVLTASQASEDPGAFAARGLGTLAASAGLFGAARAVGPRTSLATRAAVQPGEELLGIGGFRATRRLAGERTAQRFFPNQEPLIFSEEAAIRRLRGLRARGADLTNRLTVDRGGFGSGPPRVRLKSELEQELDEALQGDLEGIDQELVENLAEVERGEVSRRAGEQAEEAIRRRREAGEPLVDVEQEPFTARPTEGGSLPPRPGQSIDPSRARATRGRLTSGAVERRRRATRPSVEDPRAELERRVEDTEVLEEARERERQAQAAEVGAEAEQRLLETALADEGVLSGDLLSREVIEGIRERTEQATETVTEAVTEPEAVVEPVEIRPESETEVEFESEVDLEQFLEAEHELELELEGETEAEGELESFVEDEQDLLDGLFEPAIDVADETFASGIADVEDLERGLVEDFDDVEEELLDGRSFEDLEKEILGE